MYQFFRGQSSQRSNSQGQVSDISSTAINADMTTTANKSSKLGIFSQVQFGEILTLSNLKKLTRLSLVSLVAVLTVFTPIVANLSVSAGNQISDSDYSNYKYIVNLELKDNTKFEEYLATLPTQKVERINTSLPNSLNSLNGDSSVNSSSSNKDTKSSKNETVSNYNFLITSLSSQISVGDKTQPINYTVKAKEVKEVKGEFNSFVSEFLDVVVQVKTDTSDKFKDYKDSLKPIVDKFSTSTLQVADFKLNFTPTYLTNVSLLATASSLKQIQSSKYIKTSNIVDLEKTVQQALGTKVQLESYKASLDKDSKLTVDQKQAKLDTKTQELFTQTFASLTPNSNSLVNPANQPKLDIDQKTIEKIDQVAITKTKDSKVELNTSKLAGLGLNSTQIEQVKQLTASFNQLPEEKRDGRDQVSSKIEEIKDKGLTTNLVSKTISTVLGGVKAEAWRISPTEYIVGYVNWWGVDLYLRPRFIQEMEYIMGNWGVTSLGSFIAAAAGASRKCGGWAGICATIIVSLAALFATVTLTNRYACNSNGVVFRQYYWNRYPSLLCGYGW